MIDRGKVIKGLDEVWQYISEKVKDTGSRKARMMDKVADACNLLKEQPEIVRCKDCKHYPDGSGTKWTPCREIIVPPCWFCADGERK